MTLTGTATIKQPPPHVELAKPVSSIHPATWGGVGLVGIWLGMATVWPSWLVPIGKTQLLWQPMLVASLLIAAAIRARQDGWQASVGRSARWYLVLTLAGWLPLLHATAPAAHPVAYQAYLWLYELALSAFIGHQSMQALLNGSERALAVAGPLLLVRALYVGYWQAPLLGLILGGLLAKGVPVRHTVSAMVATSRWPLAVLCAAAALLVYGSSVRILSQTGADFPLASDDGQSYYHMAMVMARDPSLFWTPTLQDENFFSGYYPVMALWVRLVGPSLPLWLIWHGIAGGLLAWSVYALGTRVGGPWCGLIAAGLTVADHVLLQLMATMNMETFFVPVLYAALVLWVQAVERASTRMIWWSALAGATLGLATVFRPTSVLLPLALIVLMWFQRPRQPRHVAFWQALWMVGAFLVPVGLMVLRHKIAWGYWTLAGAKARSTALMSPALAIDGAHPFVVGWLPWLQHLLAEPQRLWSQMLPTWTELLLKLWTHRGFGQMDLLQGWNDTGPYQAALASVLTVGVLVGLGIAIWRRHRADLLLMTLPVYFSALVLPFYVLNSRYRAPFLPALYLLACVGFMSARPSERRTASHV